jgi:hypothetical protein
MSPLPQARQMAAEPRRNWRAARDAAATLLTILRQRPTDPATLSCAECEADMQISAEGTAYHWGNGPDNIDHDADADHVAIP